MKAPVFSALKLKHTAFKLCFQFQIAPLHLGAVAAAAAGAGAGAGAVDMKPFTFTSCHIVDIAHMASTGATLCHAVWSERRPGGLFDPDARAARLAHAVARAARRTGIEGVMANLLHGSSLGADDGIGRFDEQVLKAVAARGDARMMAWLLTLESTSPAMEVESTGPAVETEGGHPRPPGGIPAAAPAAAAPPAVPPTAATTATAAAPAAAAPAAAAPPAAAEPAATAPAAALPATIDPAAAELAAAELAAAVRPAAAPAAAEPAAAESTGAARDMEPFDFSDDSVLPSENDVFAHGNGNSVRDASGGSSGSGGGHGSGKRSGSNGGGNGGANGGGSGSGRTHVYPALSARLADERRNHDLFLSTAAAAAAAAAATAAAIAAAAAAGVRSAGNMPPPPPPPRWGELMSRWTMQVSGAVIEVGCCNLATVSHGT